VTFLFTDMEGSTRRWEEDPDAMRVAVARHDEVVRGAIEANGGYVFATGGDGFAAAFSRAADAVTAAQAAQAALAAVDAVSVRMGINTGEVHERDGDYFGPAVNRTARLMAAGHGGQVLISGVTAELVSGLVLGNLGEHRLRDLGSPLLVWQLGTSEFPPLRTLDELPGNLPVQLTSFVGREAELSALRELVAAHRMVTLTGIGGVGKTRLAVHLGAEVLDRYRNGVWLAELASVEAPRALEVMAGAIGVDLQPARTIEDCVIEDLRSRQVLLVVDNCEHILGEVRRIAELLLYEVPGVSILATSREGLRVPGEQLYSVPSLDDDSALRLFVERARSVDSGFTLGESDRTSVLAMCSRLDGIPLAIELAAARVPMFSLEDLAQRVQQRFRLLTAGRGTIERHQTLRAAVDWSYDLLSARERAAFSRLSVFAGGCTLEAAEAIIAAADLAADEVLELLSGLVDKSLVVVDRTHATTRYGMSETIRQYAEERLVASGDAEAVRARHARWYAEFARAAGRGLYSAEELSWLEPLRGELDNLQVAVAWAVGAADTDIAMRLGGSFPRQAMARPLLGTAYLAEQAMSVRGADHHPLRARVMAEAAWAAFSRGDPDRGTHLLHESIEAQRRGARYAAAAYAYLTSLWTDPIKHYEVAKDGLEAAELAGDALGAIGCRITLSAQAMLAEHDDEALEQSNRALTEARQLGQPTLEAAALYASGLALSNAEPARAITILRQSADLTARLGIESERATALSLIAALEARYGDARRGLEAMRDTLATEFPRPAFRSDLYIGIELFNRVGRPDLVARWYGVSRRYVPSAPPLYRKFNQDAVQEARAILGDEAFDLHDAEGASITPERFREALQAELDALLAVV
jgi:predicted ATPase